MKPGPEILERNLEALLRRAYVPAVPRASFRRALLEDFAGRAASRAAGQRASSQAGGRMLTLRRMAAAAAVLLVALLGFQLARKSAPAGGELSEILAGGQVAVRRAPSGPWQAVERLAASALEPGQDYLEVATPRGGQARVLLARGSAELEPATRASIAANGAGPSTLELLRGGVRAVDVLGLGIASSEGAVTVADGTARVALEAPAPLPTAWAAYPGSAWVRVEGQAGRTLLLEGGVERVLASGEHAYLRGGRVLLPPGPVAAPIPGSEGRREVPPGPAAPAEAAGSAEPEPLEPDVVLRGEVRGLKREGESVPLERFDVVLLAEVALPRVADPRRFEFEDAGGAFALGEVEPGQYTVFVRAPGFALWRSERIDIASVAGEGDVAPASPGAAPVVLTAELEVGATARGIVVDAQSGQPIADAVVLSETDAPLQILGVRAEEHPVRLLSRVTTGADGGFELEHLSTGPQVLRAWAPGRAPDWSEPLRLDASGRWPEVRFELEIGGSITGVVEDELGNALEGAFLVTSLTDFTAAHPVMTFVNATTDEHGRYEMHDLPEGSWAVLEFGAIANSREARAPDLEFVQVFPGQTSVVDFKSAIDGVRLGGAVTDAAGRPLAERSIWLVDTAARGPESMHSTTTGADGSFAFSVEPGRYALCISGTVPVDMLVLAERDLAVGADQRLDVRLPAGSIRGRVHHGETGAGLSDVVLVCVRDGTQGYDDFAGRTASGASGAFEFSNLFPGHYRLVAFSSDGLGEVESGVFEVTDEPVTGVDLELWPGGALELRVVGPEGPVANAFVRFRTPEGSWIRFSDTERTSAQGRYLIGGLRPGNWTVVVEAEGFERRTERLAIPLGETLVHTVTLERR